MLFGSLSTQQDFGFRPPSLSSLYTLVGWLEDEKKIAPPISLLPKKRRRGRRICSHHLFVFVSKWVGKERVVGISIFSSLQMRPCIFRLEKDPGRENASKVVKPPRFASYYLFFFHQFCETNCRIHNLFKSFMGNFQAWVKISSRLTCCSDFFSSFDW